MNPFTSADTVGVQEMLDHINDVVFDMLMKNYDPLNFNVDVKQPLVFVTAKSNYFDAGNGVRVRIIE